MRFLPLAPVLLLIALVAAGCGGGLDPAAGRSAQRFAAAWSAGRDAAAAAATDAPAAARRALVANRAGLDGARVQAVLGELHGGDDTASAPLTVRWQVPALGTWTSRTTLTVRRTADDAWRVHYAPRLIDSHLSARTRLGTVTGTPRRAPILDRDGRALVRERPVVQVGIDKGAHVADRAASARELAGILDLDGAALARQVASAGPRQFVPAVTLRRSDYEPLAARLRDVPGVQTVDTTAPLAPTRAFARALLGGVGEATAEQVQASHGRIAPGQQTGQWGLEQRYDARLAGVPRRRIVLRDLRSGAVVRTLRSLPGRAPRPLRTVLSTRAQSAAETALGDSGAPSAVVVEQPSTGDVLAVADRPVDSTFDRALGGAYPPGSTFKVVTTAALLRSGFSPSASVPCPPTITVDGRSFRNFEGESGGSSSFAEDFAISCNTAFISLADRLAPDALQRAGADYGLGRTLHLGVGVAASHVPPGKGAVARAATMIGQDRITATPLAMAGVAATVAAGRWHAPRVLSSDPSSAGPEIAAPELATLRTLMRGVVTHGTGTALASIPGAVAGKTGTAEYGSGDPPPTHAWFIAYRGDLAVSVLVENGASGGEVAAPIAARFLTAYGG
jgi:cell division protein FtsI/penicillin-binding protein 2